MFDLLLTKKKKVGKMGINVNEREVKLAGARKFVEENLKEVLERNRLEYLTKTVMYINLMAWVEDDEFRILAKGLKKIVEDYKKNTTPF